MRKKLTLTIDAEVYDEIKKLPRSVSISEIVSFLLTAAVEDIKKGRELTQEEFDEWIESNAERKEFREKFIEHYGPRVNMVKETINSVKEKVSPKITGRKSKK